MPMPPLAPATLGSARPPSPLPRAVAEIAPEEANFKHEKRVGNYWIGRRLGEGAFAKVKEGMHIPTGEKVAVKIIDKKKARADKYVSLNMRREAKLMTMLCHSNILRLLDEVETANSYYLVTEMAEGGDLMDHIYKNTHLPEDEVRVYIRQIVSAIDHIHKAGIIHRDLKIENLLLDGNRNIKIIDFGLSNTILPLTPSVPRENHCKTQCGSPAYAAPELLGREEYGIEVDIWSIGVNLFAMLTGTLPFTVDPFSITELHAKMLSRRMNPMPAGVKVSAECMDLLNQLLNPSRLKRIKSEEIFRHPWLNNDLTMPFEPMPFPNTPSPDNLEDRVIAHMTTRMQVRLMDITSDVVENRPSAQATTYHLLAKRLTRYNKDHPEAQRKKKASGLMKRRSMLSQDSADRSTVPVIGEDELLDFVNGHDLGDERQGRPPTIDKVEAASSFAYTGKPSKRRNTVSSDEISPTSINSSELSPPQSTVQHAPPFSAVTPEEDDVMRPIRRVESFKNKAREMTRGEMTRPLKKSVSTPKGVGQFTVRSRHQSVSSSLTSPAPESSSITPDGLHGRGTPSPTALKRGVEHAFNAAREKSAPGVWLPPTIDSSRTMTSAASKRSSMSKLSEHLSQDQGHSKGILPSSFSRAMNDVRSNPGNRTKTDSRPSNLPLGHPKGVKKNTFFQDTPPQEKTGHFQQEDDMASRRNSIVEELGSMQDHLPAINPRGSISAGKRPLSKNKSFTSTQGSRPHTTGTPAIPSLKPVTPASGVPVKFFTIEKLEGLPKSYALRQIMHTLSGIRDIEAVALNDVSVKCTWCDVILDISLPEDFSENSKLRFERIGSGGNRLRYNEICEQIAHALAVGV
eukprot:scpid23745/ scgid7370/ Hormonally up-regulated neu tumor-associated kinase; Serine/threonine-protein kinase MAK-V